MNIRKSILSVAMALCAALAVMAVPTTAQAIVYNGTYLTVPVQKQTYSANVVALAPAASATDFFTITGSATKTVKIQYVACSGISTANASATVVALKRSVANTGGTATTPTVVKNDTSPSTAGTAVVRAYTANPTTGTLIGAVRSGVLTTGPAASATLAPNTLEWTFGEGQTQEVALRGVAQVFALNGNGASFTTGAALNCSISWTEE